MYSKLTRLKKTYLCTFLRFHASFIPFLLLLNWVTSNNYNNVAEAAGALGACAGSSRP